MPTYTQKERLMSVTTALGPDVLLLTGFTGRETISQPFSFHLDLVADNKTDIPFDKVLGQKVMMQIQLPDKKLRFFNGIASRISQGERDETFTTYRMEVVPQFWLLSRKTQSRIFQHLSVRDILKKVLTGLDVSIELKGNYQPRDFCVQYRESDFAFASRLMEEEGIFYFFKHTENGHTLVLGDSPIHPDVPGEICPIFDNNTGGTREEDRVYTWEKVQELRSGKVTLWDHCFELPHKHLEADKTIADSALAGTITHKLKVGPTEQLELYDYPGEYAGRFDGVNGGGGEQPAEIQKIFEDNKRTVAIRMQEETVHTLLIQGTSKCRQLTAGHKFTLQRHFNANGAYVLTGVQHSAHLNDYRSDDFNVDYTNSFTCIPAALPFRPPRLTPRPTVLGSQTAVVVGPPGEEIFTDKYGRVKVQFHWDREGQNNADSSCWVRVSTLWAGKNWGVIHIPRIGQEVLVDFLEGNPNDPVIVGSVYNADMMPPYNLPANKTQSGIKSRSSLGGSPANFNEIRFEDKKGAEQIFIHAEKNQDIEVENNETHSVGHDRTKTIDHDETSHIKNNRTETVDKDETISIHGNRTEIVDKKEQITIGEDRSLSVGKNEDITIGANRSLSVGKNESINIAKTLAINVGDEISIVCGQASISMRKDGSIAISGKDISISGAGGVDVKATKDVVVKGMKVAIN
jgi:type VI secretion system secreted protein VgrG